MSIGLITAGAGLLGNIINNYAINRANKKRQELYNQQNRYMTPQAQMQRLVSAGLNKRLIYQNVNTSPLSRPDVEKNSVDLGFIAESLKADLDQKEAKQRLQIGDKELFKKMIEIGEVAFPGIEGPYEKKLKNENAITRAEAVTKTAEANNATQYYESRAAKNETQAQIEAIKAKYIEPDLQDQNKYRDLKTEEQKSINAVRQYDSNLAKKMQHFLDVYEILEKDEPIIQIIKQLAVHKYGRKLSQLTPKLYDEIVKYIPF